MTKGPPTASQSLPTSRSRSTSTPMAATAGSGWRSNGAGVRRARAPAARSACSVRSNAACAGAAGAGAASEPQPAKFSRARSLNFPAYRAGQCRVAALESPDTSGITTALILAHVQATGGAESVSAVLERMGRSEQRDELFDERSWWSWDTKIALFEASAEVLGDPDVTYNAGRTALERNVAAPLKAALGALGSPSLVYSNIVRANHKFSTCSRMVLEEMRGHRARIRYEHIVEGLSPHRLDCLYNQGLLSCVPALFGLPAARVEHPVCALRGGENCVYDVTWQPQVRPRWRAMVASSAGAVAATGAAASLAPAAGLTAVAVAAAAFAWMTARRRLDLVRGIGDLRRELDLVIERTD